MTDIQRQFERRNPVDGTVASRSRAMGVEDVARIAAGASFAQRSWALVGPNGRRMILLAAADALLDREDEFVAAMTTEIGATPGWAKFNVSLAASMLREAASVTTRIGGEVIPSDKPGCLALTLREPVGVIVGIAPWNAPVILGVRAIATALACGNAVILKASEICPRTHELIVEIVNGAGLPPDVLSVVTNAPADAADVVAALIDHPAVQRINFTGSTKIGRIIAKRAAAQLKPVLLELGGKAPLLVLEDADLDAAVAASAFGAFFNQGQICMSTERIIVVEQVADRFVEKLRAKASQLVAGDPLQGSAPLGAMVGRKAADHVGSLIDDAVGKGAKLLAGGVSETIFVPASVVDHVSSNMRLYAEESFGPVVAVIRVANEEEAVRVANDSEYGLSAAVFTRDTARGLSVARQIRSGICHINGPTVHDEAQMPFGGTKGSGYGRFGGQAGVDAFTELRWITMETLPGSFPI